MGDGSGLARDPAITDRGGRKPSAFPQKGNTMIQTIETVLFTATWLFIGAVAVLSLI
jgi:hypothetical protein